MTLRHECAPLVDLAAGDKSGLLVFGQLGNATFVPLLEAEGRLDKRVDVENGLLDGVLARADRDQVGVVVLPSELRGRDAPGECCAGTEHLVGGNLFAVSRA